MADLITWVGTDAGNEGDLGVAANYSPAQVPINGDSLFFSSGSQDVTGTLDQSAVTLLKLSAGPGYTGNLATSAANYKINATTVDFASGGPTAYLEGTFPTFRVTGGRSNSAMLKLDGTITLLEATGGSGTLTVVDGADLVTFRIVGASNLTTVIEANVTSLATLLMDAGALTSSSAGTAVTVRGGSAIWDTAATIGTLTMEGGVVVYTSSGTITTLAGYAGFLDGRSNANTSIAITNSTMHEGFTADFQSGLRNWSLTNPAEMRGGILKPDIGQTLTIA
jgi:hypothetical protein